MIRSHSRAVIPFMNTVYDMVVDVASVGCAYSWVGGPEIFSKYEWRVYCLIRKELRNLKLRISRGVELWDPGIISDRDTGELFRGKEGLEYLEATGS
jgi:hypothetical protein